MKSWKNVKLSEVLHHRKEFIEIDDLQTYKRARVQLHAKGIVLRDIVDGSMVKTKRQQVSQAGEFLVAEIDAKVGGFGIVPDELNDAIVSSHYFLFQIDKTKLERRFLDFFIRTPAFREQVEAQGSTNYAAIRPSHVLGYEIPLPPLAEQRRIVARIEALAAQIDEAKRLRKEAVVETEALFEGAVYTLAEQHSKQTITVEELVGSSGLKNGKSLKSIEDAESPRCLTLSSMRNGSIDPTHSKPVPLGERELQTFAIRKNDVFVVRGNGSKTLCGRAGRVDEAAPRTIFPDLFIRIDLPTERIDPAFFTLVWNSRSTREVIEENAKTTSGIWKINQGHILVTTLPLPPLPEQRRIVAELDALQTEVNTLKRLQSETAAELDALLPAILDRAFKGEL